MSQLYQAEGVDLSDPRITDYPGTGPVVDGLFFARNPTTQKDHRVPGSRMPGTSETAALITADPTTGVLTYEAPKGLLAASVNSLGFAVVTASGTTHTLLSAVTSNYDSQTGTLRITLPGSTQPTDVLAVHLYRLLNGQEHILSEAQYPFGGSGSGLPTGTTTRDPYAVGDNAAITAAVLDTTNTWTNGDLTAYGSTGLRNAGAPVAVPNQDPSILVGTADVQIGDLFDSVNGNGSAYRFMYSRRNDGTDGWTRLAKL